jgi:hypothetical protein
MLPMEFFTVSAESVHPLDQLVFQPRAVRMPVIQIR